MRCHASRACVLYRARTCDVRTKGYSRGKNPLLWTKYSSQERRTTGKGGRGCRVAAWTFLGYYSYRLRFALFLVSPLWPPLSFATVCRQLLPSRIRRHCNCSSLVKYLRMVYGPRILLMINSRVVDFSRRGRAAGIQGRMPTCDVINELW